MNSIVCPTCDNRLKQENEHLVCMFCENKFIRIGETVYINEQAIQKATKIAQETDERLGKIVEQIGVDNLTGKEGEVTGVINGKKVGSVILVNDFIVTGSAGDHIFDPILAIDEKRESSTVFRGIKQYILEKKLETPLSLLAEEELEEIRGHCGFEKEIFYSEIKRLVKEGEKVKIGTFHSHEVEARRLSEPDRKSIAIGEDPDLGNGINSSVHILISGTLIVYEYGSVEELGKITLVGYDWEEMDELLKEYYKDLEFFEWLSVET